MSEGVPHRYIFSPNHNVITYAYYISDNRKNLVLNLNLIDKGEFNVISYIKNEIIRTDKVYKNTPLYFNLSSIIHNKYNGIGATTIIIQIQMVNSKKESMVELTMYQIDYNAFYLEKNSVHNDILHGKKQKYYFFEIGKEEYGDMTIDFKRGSGNIYAFIQQRKLDNEDDEDNEDNEVNEESNKYKNIWRDDYYFPENEIESLEYNIFGKEIVIKETDTDKCDNGCYVLITIKSNFKYYTNAENETTTFRFSITPRIKSKNKAIETSKVRINLNEFVIGDIINEQNETRKYDYYTITLPYDSNSIIFDWQAESPKLLINIGENRPKIDDCEYPLKYLGKDFVYKLNKSEILEKKNLS